MMTKTERDKFFREVTADAVAILKDEVLMAAQEIQQYRVYEGKTPSQLVSEVLYSLHDNLKHREEDLRDNRT